MSSEHQDSPHHGVENNAIPAPQDTDAELCPKPRRSKVMTLKKLYVQIRLGFGQGHGSEYQPWLKIRRKNSSPNSNQVVSWMPPLGRTAHYFSHGEFHSALLLLWLGVQDLREQYPLWPMPHPHPLSGTPGAEAEALKLKWSRGLLAIAEDAGIKHGVEVGTHIPYVATIDLLATVRLVDGVRLIGFSSKPISDVDDEIKQRTLERLEMERRYFAEINAGYFVSSSSLVPSLMAGQLECWLDYSTLDCSPELMPLVDQFAEHLNNHDDLSISEAVTSAAALLSITIESAWFLFRHCGWTQKIDIDPSIRVITSHPLRRGGLALRTKLREKFFGGNWI
ncbi:MAG: TnsA endonuclease N-terminal domain-containing protein [Gallionella sp.]|nr:TnsA endonuclease N-terminal domain-containing protein [Gallionella sp.]